VPLTLIDAINPATGGRLGAPLIAANTVVLKPSEHTSLSALRLRELVERIHPAARRGQRRRRTSSGPVLAAMPFGRYEEAVRIANSVGYDLTASVFTRDLGDGPPLRRRRAGRLRVEELRSSTQLKNVNVKF
jgi:acyl-CoA reductase-like NAD-dependent aldehyde dehydrogenase